VLQSAFELIQELQRDKERLASENAALLQHVQFQVPDNSFLFTRNSPFNFLSTAQNRISILIIFP